MKEKLFILCNLRKHSLPFDSPIVVIPHFHSFLHIERRKFRLVEVRDLMLSAEKSKYE